jgi:ATP-dependent DNA ligase
MAAPGQQLENMLPTLIKPMLAQPAPEPFDSAAHLFEIKWDGIRCLAFVGAGGVRLQSRQLLEITAQFPELSALRSLPAGTVLDGELVALKDGKPSLAAIQRRTHLRQQARIGFLSRSAPVTYMVFDLLYCRGKPLLKEPLLTSQWLGIHSPDGSPCLTASLDPLFVFYPAHPSVIERREALQHLMARIKPAGVMVPEAIPHHGRILFAQVAALGWEGVMAKHQDSPYLMGRRSRLWLKIKTSAVRSNARVKPLGAAMPPRADLGQHQPP